MKYVIDFLLDQDVARDVVLDEPEILVPSQVRNVRRVTGDEVIDPDDPVPLRQEPIRQMRPKKPRPTCNHRNFLRCHSASFLIRALRSCERFSAAASPHPSLLESGTATQGRAYRPRPHEGSPIFLLIPEQIRISSFMFPPQNRLTAAALVL